MIFFSIAHLKNRILRCIEHHRGGFSSIRRAAKKTLFDLRAMAARTLLFSGAPCSNAEPRAIML
jgi:hypothetical protein